MRYTARCGCWVEDRQPTPRIQIKCEQHGIMLYQEGTQIVESLEKFISWMLLQLHNKMDMVGV